MALVRLVNKADTHLFIDCLSKNLPPHGTWTVDDSIIASQPELATVIGSGRIGVEQLDKVLDEEPKDISGDETLEMDMGDGLLVDTPESEPDPEEEGAILLDIDKEDQQKSTSYVRGVNGPMETEGVKIPEPAHFEGRFKKQIADPLDTSIEVKGKEFVDGVEVIDTESVELADPLDDTGPQFINPDL